MATSETLMIEGCNPEKMMNCELLQQLAASAERHDEETGLHIICCSGLSNWRKVCE